MSNTPETDEGSSTIDELLKELENETLPEDSSSSKNEKIKDKQADETLKKIKHEKPEWADKKNDDYNTYDYSDDKELDDKEW